MRRSFLALAALAFCAAASAQPAGPLGLDPTTGLPALPGLEAPALPNALGRTATAAVDWSPVGDVNPFAADGTVYAVLEAPNKTVYVGGDFSEIYGVPADGLAAYDLPTGTWSALGGSLSGGTGDGPVVYALAMSGGQLVVGGDFASADGVGPVPNLVGYDPVAGAFIDLESRWPRAARVKALAVGPNGALFVGGHGTPVASEAPPSGGLVYRSPGGVWVDLEANLKESFAVQAIVPDPANGRVWVGSDSRVIGGVGGDQAKHLASYTFGEGGGWEEVPGFKGESAVGGGVRALALADDGRLYVGGQFESHINGLGLPGALAVYDTVGETWSSLGDAPGKTSYQIYDLALADDGRLYIGGRLSESDAFASLHLAVYDPAGDAWASLDVATEPRAVTATGSGVLVAGEDGGPVQRWTGAAWEFFGPTRFDTSPYAAAATADGTIYAVGWFTTTPNGAAYGAAAFDGTAWHPVGGGLSGARGGGRAVGFDAEVGPDGRLYVGGDFRRAGGVEVSGLAVWDGVAWSRVGEGIASFIAGFNPYIRDVTFAPDGTLYVGVSTFIGTSATDLGPTLVLAWDGVSWSQVGDIDRAGIVLKVLSASDGTLYAAGQFYDGGVITPTGDPYGVLAYDGTGWTRIDSDLDNPTSQGLAVYDLVELADGRVVAAGTFQEAGGQPAQATAAWDGVAWTPFGENLLDSSVGFDLFRASDGALYLAGGLGGIDGAVAYFGIARLDVATEEWVAVDGLGFDHFIGLVESVTETPQGGLVLTGVEMSLNGVEVNSVIQSEPPLLPSPFVVGTPEPLGAYAWGDTVPVRWETAAPDVTPADAVDVSVLCPGEPRWTRYPATANDGQAGITLPAFLGTHGTQSDQASGCVVEVALSSDPSRASTSAPFVVLDPAAALAGVTTRALERASPRKPARYGLEDRLQWQWDETSLPETATVRVALVCDDGAGGRVEWVRSTATANDGRVTGTLPTDFGAYATCRAEVSETGSPDVFGRSAPFEVLDVPLPAVEATAPLDGAVVAMGADYDVTWETTAFDPSAAVRLTLRDLTGGTGNQTIALTTNTGSYTWSVPTDLDPAEEYRVIVKVTADDGTVVAALVDPVTFTAAAAQAAGAGLEAPPEVLTVEAPRPNPSGGRATVRVGVPEAGPVEVAVFDAVGRRVAVALEGERPAGWAEVGLEASGLAPGVYVVRAVAGEAVVTRTLTVVR